MSATIALEPRVLVWLSQDFDIIPRVVGVGVTIRGVARDPRGRVRRLEPQGRGAFGFFLPVSAWFS